MLAGLLLGAACVSLVLPGSPGRAYPGRKKAPSFPADRHRVGPHVCLLGFGSGCCPGWMPSPASGQCTLPLCSFGCGSGWCIAPNVCSCRDGEQGITCPDPPSACGEYGCDLACNHGGCQEVARVCPLGFSMAETANGVRCTDTDECLATPCQHRCKNSIGSYRCFCRPGYHLHSNQHSCLDVNECRRPSERRPCQHACHNTPGSFLCTCHPGYRLSGDRVSCEGFLKTILAPSPILQSLQHPPTLLLLPPDSGGPLLAPRASPPSQAPAPSPRPPSLLTAPPHISPLLPAATAAPGAFSPLPPSLFQGAVLVPSPRPSASLPPALTTSPPPCWHQGAPREHSSHWMEPGCLQCACEGGQVVCKAESCRIACSHPLPPKDRGCCPSCTGCWHEGVARAEGDVFSVADGNCTVCMCLAGNVSCISPECPPGPCPSPPQADCCSCQPATCDFHGRTYMHGAEFGLDGDNCTTCICQSGELECSVAPCPELACPRQDWLLAPGQCCFSCQEPASVSGCFVDNGVEFPIGQIWSPGDPCELCICQADGSVSCKRTDCLETCPHPIEIPGQCCPDCSAGCTYMGRIFYNNEIFPSALDPCLSCICLLGSVACSPVDCIIFCMYPFHPEGECCPVCYDCNYEGRKVVNGQTFVPEGEPCIHCTCQLGEVSCERRPCAQSCTEPSALPAACCPACQDAPVPWESSPGPVHTDDAEVGKSPSRNPRENSMAQPRASDCRLCPSSSAPASPSPELQLLAGRNTLHWDAGPVNTAGPTPAGPRSFGYHTAPSGPSVHPIVLMETSRPGTAAPSPDQPPSLTPVGPRTALLTLTPLVAAPQKHSTVPSEGVEPPPREASTPTRPAA
ncbi:von Willebrand factor C and EGF domain-containing protein isoform X3 [Dermochelys coriacea]|uniref:von Willebrand factor C and EGF domain-containing protein isoform X3 n=1 Tax=Dermochelys coriacea TaxID=27794 RepID=UPI001CA82BF6|nr:von Willebrand factor C and EGF domain-containing protein isoform X3 [Dermochelys coriacea]